MKQLEVQIMGQSYLLGCPEGGDVPLLHAVERVDTAMCKIRDAGKVRARERIAVLAALNLAFELVEAPVLSPVSPSGSMVIAPVAVASNDGLGAVSGAAVIPGTKNEILSSLLHRLDTALEDDGQLI